MIRSTPTNNNNNNKIIITEIEITDAVRVTIVTPPQPTSRDRHLSWRLYPYSHPEQIGSPSSTVSQKALWHMLENIMAVE